MTIYINHGVVFNRTFHINNPILGYRKLPEHIDFLSNDPYTNKQKERLGKSYFHNHKYHTFFGPQLTLSSSQILLFTFRWFIIRITYTEKAPLPTLLWRFQWRNFKVKLDNFFYSNFKIQHFHTILIRWPNIHNWEYNEWFTL